MPDKPGLKEVYVEVDVKIDTNFIAPDFSRKKFKPPSYVVKLRLSEETLKLKGASFVAAARSALQEVLIGTDQVHVEKNLFVDPNPMDPECIGYKVPVESLSLRDKWYTAEPQEKT